MEKTKTKLADDQIILKMSICGKCKNMVRVAGVHDMTKESTKEFLNEVLVYNLSVKEMSLIDYRKENPDFCECD